MKDLAAQRLFHLLDRALWLIWLGFPVLVWIMVRQILDAPAQLAALAPEQAACLKGLPMVANFSAPSQTAFWGQFAVEMAVYAVLLWMAHRVIHRCATGQVFVAAMIGTLRRIGLVIALYPLVELVLTNLTMLVYLLVGDLATYLPDFALNLPVIGVGLLLVTMAAAMRMAVDLHRDAELTI
jgi:hypothetical protein